MGYIKSQNTYFAIPQNNPKDRINLEVGDSKQPDFKPQMKVMRWDNEVNVSIRLVQDEINPIVFKDGDKIIWEGKKIKLETYPKEESHEFEVILKEKPDTNVIQFTLQDKGVDYFYQPALTAEEIAEGNERPDNVVGSYAVYAKESKLNIVGGKEYKCGKVGHIFRPRIEDAKGNWTWGDLNIMNGILSVTIPQKFLDTAVYPIRHASGLEFGYHTTGASTNQLNAIRFRLSRYTADTTGTITAFYLYCNADSTENLKLKTAAYSSNGSSDPSALLGQGSEITGITTTYDWWTGSASIAYIAGEIYLGMINSYGTQAPAKYGNIKYDSTGERHYSATGQDYGAAAWPNPWTEVGGGNDTQKFSCYATYTASASGPAKLKTWNGLPIAKVKTINGLPVEKWKTWNGLA